ncbi:MAG: carboxypeptidase regulatory-like domain-containing protein [Gammaproteobacteria bacterium]|nr:carboxypeptidase regulatory-like domain-containing protein [Gammaproteobacteria bacterium]MDX2461539.1 carboxypeptidase regulatory-like domain-containing protein [Gammaproteobacteria bacterium]
MPNSSRIVTLLVALMTLSAAALMANTSRAASSAEVTPPTTLNLWRQGDPGQPVRISGWVRSTNGEPVAGATIYIRQADGTGDYTPEYQGMLKTGKDGSYRFSTVVPGQYYGIKHIHIGAAHDGYEYLETEILFKGDPNLDPQSDSEFAIHLEEATVKDKTVLFGRFDMMLRPLGSD